MGTHRRSVDLFERFVVPPLRFGTAAILMLLMLFTCIDVLGRYLFNRPLWGGFELTELMLAMLIFAALPLVTLRAGHIKVDLLDSLVPAWLSRIQNATTNGVAFACTAYLAYRLWLRAGQLIEAGETTVQIQIRLGYVTYAMASLMGLTAVAFALLMFQPGRGQAADEETGL